VLQAGAGQGISNAAKEISKFYLDLARQTMPVIEVGAVRDVTLVISEGVELEIKEINKGEELP
jgi:conjugal transfer pilus assembly protein TraB